MNPSFYRRDGTNQEMASSPLTLSLLLLSLVFMQFVSAADLNNSTVKATVGEKVILPCRASNQEKIRLAEWKRTDLRTENVLLYRNLQIDPADQTLSYKDRVDLLINKINRGDVSLLLENTTTDDSGTYECRVLQGGLEKKLISTVSLQVSPPPPPDPFPVWVIVLLVLLVLSLVAAAGVSFYFWLPWKPVPEHLEVESGVKFVLLPFQVPRFLWFCKYRIFLHVDKVEWMDVRDRKVHVYQNGSDQPEDQDEFYRTKMDENLLKTGDLSLTLSWPTGGDGGKFTCRVYSKKGDVLMEKHVELWVKVRQVEVEPGVESVLLPCRTAEDLDRDVRVEWRDEKDKTVHVYEDGSDQPGEQAQFYRTRTKMDENLLETKDLSLTLRRPTDGDSNIYTCSVYRAGDDLMVKQVELVVTVHQEVVEPGDKSVKLPWTITEDLDGDVRVEWRDNRDRKVHVYQNGSDQPGEQHQDYRTRTNMDEKPLENKDLSLTLIRPTDGYSNIYTCRVYSRDGNILMKKNVRLMFKAKTVQVQPEDIRKPLLADQSV